MYNQSLLIIYIITIFSHRVYNSPSTIGQKCDILPSVPKEWNETFAAALRSENILEKKERKMNMKKFLAIMMALSMMLYAFAVAETASPVASTVASPVASPVADMVGDPADLPAIAAVLNGGSEVYVPSDKTNKTLQDALNHEFTEGAGYDSFAVLDVDGDGKLDVVLNVTVNGEVLGYLVLTSADDWPEGRWLLLLQQQRGGIRRGDLLQGREPRCAVQ